MDFDGQIVPRSSHRDDSRDYDPDYKRDRQRIDLKLKGTFERIFEKYTKDFSDVGDEVDVLTGEVFVNNGHLTFMQNERDTGKSASSRFVRDFADELEQEEADPDDDDDEDEDEEEDAEHSDEQEEEDAMGIDDAADEAEDEQSADESDDLAHDPLRMPLDPRLAQNNHLGGIEHFVRPEQQQNENSSIIPSVELSRPLLPISIPDSLNQLIPHQDASGRIDPDAINALGQSIANQIAQFLMRATSVTRQPYLPQPSDSAWTIPALPEDAFTPPSFLSHQHRHITPAPLRSPSVADSPPGARSLWAPAGPRKKRRKLIHHTSTSTSFNLDPALTDDNDFSDATSSNRGRRVYTREEDDLIKRLRDIEGMPWEQIIGHMPGRTIGGVSSRYTRILKYLPRPVIVKREIIEIMDGEDEDTSIPGGHTAPESPDRPPPNTPLLRQALLRRGNTGDAPITIGDDDGSDSQRESSADLPSRVISDGRGGYYEIDPVTQIAQPIPGPEPKTTSKPLPTYKPRYRTFDTSNPAAHFGVLRPESPAPFTPAMHTLDPRYAGTSGYGVLRLTQAKPSKSAKPKAPRTSQSASTPRNIAPGMSGPMAGPTMATHPEDARGHVFPTTLPTSNNQYNMVDPILVPPNPYASREHTPMHPPPPYSVNPVEAATHILDRTQTVVDLAAHDGDVSDPETIDTPAPTRRYGDAIDSTLHNNGPYFVSSLPPQSPQVPSPHTQMRAPSPVPAFPTPFSQVSGGTQRNHPFTERLYEDVPTVPGPSVMASRAPSETIEAPEMDSPTRNLVDPASLAKAPPGPGEMARMVPEPTTKPDLNARTTAKTSTYGTPVRDTVGRKEMMRKRVLPEPDDTSEDELA